jgi:hypothetical protein
MAMVQREEAFILTWDIATIGDNQQGQNPIPFAMAVIIRNVDSQRRTSGDKSPALQIAARIGRVIVPMMGPVPAAHIDPGRVMT